MPRTPKPPVVEVKPINKWVASALKHSGMSQTAMASALAARGVVTSNDRSFVNKMVLGKRDVSAEEAKAIAEIADYPPFGVDGSLKGPAILRTGTTPPYAGIIQAGQFLAVDEYFNQDPDPVPSHVLPDPAFARVRQYAWRARGDSMDEAGIFDGMWVVGADAADYIDTYGDIQSGDLVVVERTRYQRSERELTVKEVHFFRDRYELRPVSSNLSHSVITVPHDHGVDGDGVEVKIIGVVLTAYANLRVRRAS
jgi:SOS-response transcriptional repressor LexA